MNTYLHWSAFKHYCPWHYVYHELDDQIKIGINTDISTLLESTIGYHRGSAESGVRIWLKPWYFTRIGDRERLDAPDE